VLNATSTGHAGGAPPVAPAWFAPGGLCYDLNYGPAAEPLRERCRRHAIAYADGLGMLVGQAAESFRLWTGFRPETGLVIAALREAG
jgi:shikimate dehydrogenase